MEHPPSPFKTQLAREFFKLFSRVWIAFPSLFAMSLPTSSLALF